MSVSQRLADAVVAVLEGLDWGAGVTPLVVSRKRPTVTAHDDCSATQPVVCVSVEGEDVESLWAGVVMVTYSVGVSVARPTANLLGETSWMRDTRETLRKAIHGEGTFAGVSETNEVRPGGRPPWDPAALSANYEWGWYAFRVECIEPRA